MDGASTFYAALHARWSPSLHSALSETVSSGLSGVAADVDLPVILFIIIQGCLIMFRQYDFWRGMSATFRAGAVALLLTAAGFNDYVQVPFTQTIPAKIGEIAGGTGVRTGPEAFDAIQTNLDNFVAQIDRDAGSYSISDAMDKLHAHILQSIAGAFLMVVFIMWEFALTAVNLVVCLGPFVIATYLFTSTRNIAARWLGKMIGLLVLMLLVMILLNVALGANVEALRTAQATGGGLDVRINALVFLALSWFCSALFLVALPSIAAAIGGGAVFNTALAPVLAMTSAIRAGQRASRAAAVRRK